MKLKLTALAVEKLRPVDGKQMDVYDAGARGLLLRLSPAGKKTWCCYYRREDGRNRRLTLGVYPDLSLSDARGLAHKHLRNAALGEDPAGEKRRKREAETFAHVAGRFLAEYAEPNLAARTAAEYRREINRHLLPAWRHRRLSDITRADVIALANKIKVETPVMANRVAALVGSVFSWAQDAAIATSNPASKLGKIRTVERPRERVLSDAEIRAIWEVAEPSVRLVFLVAARRSEVGLMTWSEVDFDQGLWVLPASRTKSKRTHVIPLSRMAMALLRGLPREGERVFPGGARYAYVRARAAAGLSEAWGLHDIRRTVRTNLSKIGVPPHVSERVLGHSQGKLVATYDTYSYLDEQRDALERWATRIEQITGANVVPLRATDGAPA